ncbi:hypothetical protein DFR60_10486 [Hungatella effluvii]|uniref:Flavodoxin n=1 Tax=Hungatella effluvii TaxID=1096246 RepID=A0A2V3Y6K1_9FIRM|nr:cyclophilin-like fold protein [Hungatella effluvii]PXX54261.1 hypothetical protein DFR60_10486 [Hungatella effluvii]
MKFKKLAAGLLCLMLSICLMACAGESEVIDSIVTRNETEIQMESQGEETSQEASVEPILGQEKTGNGNILIAYFTWADNTYVENPDAVDVDATTSASVLPPGNAALLASWIQESVGGDLFSIIVEEPYSSDYDECLDRAAEERAQNARPTLTSHVEDMSRYDIVFLGLPNWWYGSPMAVLSFLEEYDFTGKTIIPFVTHGTGGFASTLTDIQSVLPDDITMLEAIGIYRPEVKESHQAVQEWIAGLGIDFDAGEGSSAATAETGENRVQISFRDMQVVVKMEDNSASRNLLEQLPLTLEFEDYNRTEKIAYMDAELDYGDAPDSCNAVAGVMAYYIPWGNLSLFYEDFRESDQLVPLGMVESGQEFIRLLENGESVLIERIE